MLYDIMAVMSLSKYTPVAQHANQKPAKLKLGRAILISLSTVLATVLVAALVIVGVFENKLKSNSVDLNVTAEGEQASPPPPPQMFKSREESFTMAVIGEDSGDGNKSYGTRDHILNDVNMVLHVYPGWKQATVMSFPRDLIVDIPECVNPETKQAVPAGVAKINTALTRGGLPCAVETLSELSGHPIDNALMVGFDGVVALSNAVGGVEVCLSEPIKDRHSKLDLEAGPQTLQGDDALGFLRTRYGVGDGSDLSRISNQQVFLSSLLRKLKSEETLTDPQKILNLANAVADNTVLSSNLASVSTLGDIAYSLRGLDLKEVTFVQVPTYYPDGVNGVYLQEADAEELFETVFANKVFKITGGTGPGQIGSIKQDTEDEGTPNTQEEPDASISGYGNHSSGQLDSTLTPEPTEKVDVADSVTGQTADEATCSRGYVG